MRGASHMSFRGSGLATITTDKADGMQQKRLELWRQWEQKLPDNAFVRRQLEAAALPQLIANN